MIAARMMSFLPKKMRGRQGPSLYHMRIVIISSTGLAAPENPLDDDLPRQQQAEATDGRRHTQR